MCTCRIVDKNHGLRGQKPRSIGDLIQNPVVLVLRVGTVAIGRLAHVFAAGAAGLHHRTHLFTGILGIKIVKKITERGKIVISTLTVHSVIDGDEPHIVAWKNDFRVPADLQIVSAKSTHVLDDPGTNQALLHQRKPLLHTGTIEVRPGIPVIHQNPGVSEAPFYREASQDISLRSDLSRVFSPL